MNINLFDSSQIMPRFLLYFLAAILIIIGVGIIAYEALDIIKMQQSISSFDQQLKQSIQKINRQLAAKSKVGLSQSSENNSSANQDKLEIKDNLGVNPFQPKLEKIKKRTKQPKDDLAKSNLKSKDDVQVVNLSMVGALINSKVKMAIIKLENGRNKRVQEGDLINNFLVKDIKEYQVVIVPTNNQSLAQQKNLKKEFVLKMGGLNR